MFLKLLSSNFRKLAYIAMLVWSGCAFADDDYSAGLSAFIDGNYELAQAHWIKSAKNENYRAMFNLGLLHDQAKIANADPEKAERWFRLAGKGGYAAADYHHATRLIEKNANPREVRALLERAASNGYQPAKTKLVSISGSTSMSIASAQNPNSPQIADTATTTQTYLSEEWLLAQNSSEWTIQLLAFQNQARVKEFIDVHRLHDQAAYFADEGDSGTLYKLVYGAFSNKKEADQARDRLSTELQEYGPWLRTIARVQDIIKSRDN